MGGRGMWFEVAFWEGEAAGCGCYFGLVVVAECGHEFLHFCVDGGAVGEGVGDFVAGEFAEAESEAVDGHGDGAFGEAEL